ncbi:MAG TPA: Hsp70 family protein [Actinoplanes sp.]|nr:Hsp70 family protein [Actinoplanes sp.]
MYALGIDLGTTYTAAATWRNGHAETASLGSRAASIPSVVLLREDETFLTGEGASRRGLTQPHRVAREFKRRLGDTTPILLGGVPYSAEALTARLLRSVVDQVVQREGGSPAAICVSHPANWGPYKTDLLLQAVRLAGLEEPVSFTSEPEAAAIFYAQQQRIEPGAVIAVYDLGGGTFDAAVLRKTPVGFEILGRPEGIERLGGIDFDAAVFSHVAGALGGKLQELDEDDAAAIASVARLREECIDAKEALSADTDVSIPVLLPNLNTEIRLTRAELEAMVRPALYDSIEAMKRALRSAKVQPDQLHSVLLVGGSSRMPVVAQLVGAELGRPVAVDAHPKHAVALGAAWLASGQTAPAPMPRAVTGTPMGTASTGAGRPPAATGAGSPPAATPIARVAGSASVAGAAPRSVPAAVSPRGSAPTQLISTVYGTGAPSGPPLPPRGAKRGRRRLVLLIAAGVALLLGSAGAWAMLVARDRPATGGPAAQAQSAAASPAAVQESAAPADEQCTDEIKANPRWVCLTKATISGDELRIEYEFSDNDRSFNINGGFHLHIYGADEDGSDPADARMGSHADNPGDWYIDDEQPSVHRAGSSQYKTVSGHPKVCARIAQGRHRLVPDVSDTGTFHTGNCVPLEKI